jgi:hypothetical protein
MEPLGPLIIRVRWEGGEWLASWQGDSGTHHARTDRPADTDHWNLENVSDDIADLANLQDGFVHVEVDGKVAHKLERRGGRFWRRVDV